MKTREELREKVWFRFLKVIFWITFLVIQALTIWVCWDDSHTKIPIQENFTKIGEKFKNLYPNEYQDKNNNDLGKRLYEKRYSIPDIWEKINLEPIYTYGYQYKNAQRLVIIFFPMVLVGFVFYLFAKLFFYIALGESLSSDITPGLTGTGLSRFQLIPYGDFRKWCLLLMILVGLSGWAFEKFIFIWVIPFSVILFSPSLQVLLASFLGLIRQNKTKNQV